MNNLNEQNIAYSKSDNLLKDARQIIERTRKYAYNAINIALVQRNWLLGKRIAEEELQGENRAKYGEEIIETLSKELTKIYDKGFDYSSLYKYSKFYKLFPEILDSLSPESCPILSWTHYRVLLQVENNDARNWYMKEAAQQTWSVRTLQRNIASQYYFRILQSQHKDLVEKEMQKLTTPFNKTSSNL